MAEINTRIRNYFNQKPTKTIRYQTIELSHSATGVFRFVKDFVDHDFGLEADAPNNPGETVTFQALNFEIPEPSQTDTPNINIPIQLGRIGSGLKEQLKKITGFDFMESALVIYRVYLSDDTTTPVKTYKLFASEIGMQANNVAINAEDDNPTNMDVSRVYTFEDFPGLKEL